MVRVLRISIVAVLLVESGCATIFSRSEYSLKVDCNEPDCSVEVYKGRRRISTLTTPGSVSLNADDDSFSPAEYRFEFSKEDCVGDRRMVQAKIDPWFWGNLFIGGIIGILIDSSTGAMWKFDEDSIVKGYVQKDRNATSDAPIIPVREDKLEDSTETNIVMVAERQENTSYKIISLDRESGKDFSYRFVIELKDDNGDPLRMFRMIQRKFRAAIKEDYAESFPNVSTNSLFVEFSKYKLDNNRIEGCAMVLTISVTSLTYDPKTKNGKLAVRVNANQYEEARKWIRKNIETLATDKNIVLTSGERPAPGKFTLGREEFDNVAKSGMKVR